MGGSKNKPQETTTKQEPWEGAKPYWQQTYADIYGNQVGQNAQQQNAVPGRGLAGLKAIPNSGQPVTTGAYGDTGLLGSTKYIGATPNMQAAYGMVQDRAGTPSAMLAGAEDYATRMLSGEFLDPSKNLALAQNLQRGMEDMGAWDTSAIQSGRYGGGAWGAGRGRQLADLQGNLYGQGLQQMTQIAGMAPSIYEAGYLPAQKLLALGAQQQQDQQAEQMFPWELRGMAANLLSGAGGGSTSSPYYKPNPLMGALGGAGTGFAVGGPVGAAVGGGLGYMGSK